MQRSKKESLWWKSVDRILVTTIHTLVGVRQSKKKEVLTKF
jgi:hypothetical protein